MRSVAGMLMLGLALWGACRPAAPTTPAPPAAPSATAAEPGERPEPTEDPGNPGWTELAREEGIIVTSRPSEQSPLPIFRGVGVVDAPLLEVFAVVLDADRHHEWIFSCSASGLVAQNTEISAVVYNRTATPWPVPDRDVVLDSRVEVIDGEREIVVRFFATEHPQKPPEDGVVRMTYLRGHYHLWAEGEGRTRVEYQVDSDPGGRLPTWLATRGTREMPLESLKGLRAQVAKTRGTYEAQLEAIRRTVRMQ
ncbi:MAG: START domain-containing protein [Myxococcota bacterium]